MTGPRGKRQKRKTECEITNKQFSCGKNGHRWFSCLVDNQPFVHQFDRKPEREIEEGEQKEGESNQSLSGSFLLFLPPPKRLSHKSKKKTECVLLFTVIFLPRVDEQRPRTTFFPSFVNRYGFDTLQKRYFSLGRQHRKIKSRACTGCGSFQGRPTAEESVVMDSHARDVICVMKK